MELQRRLERIFRDDRAWLLLLALATAVSLTFNLFGLLYHVTIVAPHLLYFPIIIASYRFPRRGVLFASCIGLVYVVMVCLVPPPAAGDIISAAARFVVLVAIGWVVAYLSLNLKEQEERYRGLFDHSEAGSFVVRLDGPVPIIEDANFRGAEILGTRAAEMAGEPFRTFWDDPGNLEEFISGIRKNGARYSHEARLVRKDGTHVEGILSAGAVSDSGFIVTLVDITDRKRTEDAFRQANRELNLLSGVTRNDLLGVTGRLSEMLRSGKERCQSPEARDLAGRLWEPVRYIRRRLELTKYYQDLGVEEPVWHHVQEVILNEASRPDPGTVSLRVWTERLEVYADRLLKNVFSNLLDNAVRHGKGATDIVVTYRLAGDGLDLVVEDNGPGIPDTDKEAIFEYGSEKHPGLGLFIDREILGVTGISITETGVPGSGARFEIHIPSGAFRIV